MITVNQPSSTLNTINELTNRRDREDEKVASGRRINRAADDPAGLQISSRLTAEINQSSQLSVNAQDQINTNAVQESQFSAINDSLQRANELAVQAGNPLVDSQTIQGELDQITEQVNTIAGDVLGDANFLSGVDASDPAAAQDAINTALSTINEQTSALGANSNALSSQVSTYQAEVVNVSEGRSRIQDTDIARSSSEQQQLDTLVRASIIAQRDDEDARRGLLINQIV